MDRNNVIGLLLIALVLIGFSWWSQPSSEEKRQAEIQDSIALVQQKKAAKAKAGKPSSRKCLRTLLPYFILRLQVKPKKSYWKTAASS